MKIKNLVKLDSWDAYADNLGSSYNYLKNNGLKISYENEEFIGIKMKVINKKNAWSSLVFSLFDWHLNRKVIDISKSSGLAIMYKTTGNNRIKLHLKEKETSPESMHYISLPPSKNWQKLNINFKDFNPLKNNYNRKLNLHMITEIVFNFDFGLPGGEDTLYIKELLINGYIIDFNFIDYKIYRDSIIYKLKNIFFRNINIKKLVQFILSINKCNNIFQILWIIQIIDELDKYKNNGKMNKYFDIFESKPFPIIAYEKTKRIYDYCNWIPADIKNKLNILIKKYENHTLKEKYRFTSLWFDCNIKEWQKTLARFINKPNLSFLEIGSYEGRSTIWLLENILTDKSSKITCIDIFNSYYSYIFDENIKRGKYNNKVTKLNGKSIEILRNLNFNSYDFIYIDGDHSHTAILEDTILCWELLKINGIMIFDDYKIETKIDQKPKIAIDAFLKVFKDKIKITNKKYQVAIEKIKS